MTARAERACPIHRERKAVDEAIRFAQLATTYCDKASREATVLAVAELTENVLKYAASEQGSHAGTITIGVDGQLVRIRARNVISSRKDADSLMSVVSKIASAANVRQLYRDRLRQLFEKPSIRRAQLGLLRVAFEGGFRLSASYQADVIEIVAERDCREAG